MVPLVWHPAYSLTRTAVNDGVHSTCTVLPCNNNAGPNGTYVCPGITPVAGSAGSVGSSSQWRLEVSADAWDAAEMVRGNAHRSTFQDVASIPSIQYNTHTVQRTTGPHTRTLEK